MKKIVVSTLLIGLVLVSSAYASKARLEALGEDHYGSQYIDDNRNMFLNAAQIHNHFDFVNFEFGNTNNTTGVLSENDAENSPKATGGYFAKNDGAVYGIYFGQESNTATGLKIAPIAALAQAGALTGAQAVSLVNAVSDDNVIDFFYGRDGAFKWGVRFGLSRSNNERGQSGVFSDSEQERYIVAFGALSGDWEYYANIGAGTTAEVNGIAALGGVDYSVEANYGYQLGVIKDIDGAKAFFEYRGTSIKQSGLGTLGGNDFNSTWDVQKFLLGYGNVKDLGEGLRGLYRVEYYMDRNENFAYVDNYEVNTNYLKATLGFEADVLSWLALRGSVSNFLLSEEDQDGGNNDGKKTLDGVNLALGASLKFDDFIVDGLIANDRNGDGSVTDDGGVLRSDALMSRVSFNYNF